MLLVKAFLKIFGVCSKLMKFALKRRKFAFLNRNKDADRREGENKKEVAAWSVSLPSPSPSVTPLPRGEALTKGKRLCKTKAPHSKAAGRIEHAPLSAERYKRVHFEPEKLRGFLF